ncbi:Xylosidase/arabinosidase, partial [termite gut metagenome]
GDCVIYASANDRKTLFARVTVGWQVQNPVLPYSWGMYIPDPEVHNFNGQLYVYGSLDGVPKAFCSPYYVSLTSRDMKRWESRGYSFSSFDKGCPYQGRILWDPDGSYYNGKYLLYGFFEPNSDDNNMFVLESDNPTGRFKNFRWVVGNKSGERVNGISAQIFGDDDGARYILYAPTQQPIEKNYPVIARLVDDNVIDESSVKNLGSYVRDFFEAPSMRKRGDTYYLIYAENCGPITHANHTPKRLSYATSKEIFGEYTYRGTIVTVEDIPNEVNIQGSIEPFGNDWYVFYHRGMNNVWNQRSLCIEKIEFDKDGLIKPVVPTSSGIAEGLNTSKPIYFNTAVTEKNCRFSNDGKYGSVVVNGTAGIGFRYVLFTGKEKKLTLQGEGLGSISNITVTANGKVIGQSAGGEQDIKLNNVKKGKAELVFSITSNGETKIETLHFGK